MSSTTRDGAGGGRSRSFIEGNGDDGYEAEDGDGRGDTMTRRASAPTRSSSVGEWKSWMEREGTVGLREGEIVPGKTWG